MKILIISYYAFPLNAVPSYRIESFCEGFTRQGADVTLLTRHWDKTFKSWEEIIASNDTEPIVENKDGYRQVSLPFKAFRLSKYPLVNKIKTFKSYLLGNIQPEIDTYTNFKDYALKLMQKEGDFDLILVSAPPNNLAKLAYYLHKKTKVPYVVDFRDFLNNEFVKQGHVLSMSEKVLNTLSITHLKKYLKESNAITTVSERFVNILNEKFNKKAFVVWNGYEIKHFSTGYKLLKNNKVFTLRHIGTAYQGFNFEPLIKGVQMFSKKFPNFKLNIELIGTDNNDIENYFISCLGKEKLQIIKERIPKKDVVDKTINADVLILAWNLYKKHYGTKVFDYLASGSHILLCPPDNSIVEDLIRNHENGSVANTAEEVVQILEEQYALWEKGENKSKINNYPQFARENIAVEFYQKLKALVE